MIAQIHQLLELLEGIGADLLLGDHALDFGAVPRGQLHEAQTAGIAQEQHATGDAHHVIGFLTGFELAVVLGAHGLDGGGDVQMHRIGRDAAPEHHGALGHAHLDLLGVGQRAEFLVGGVHGLVKGRAPVDLRADGGVLRQQHLGPFHGSHLRHGGGFVPVVAVVIAFYIFCHRHTVYGFRVTGIPLCIGISGSDTTATRRVAIVVRMVVV